MSAVKLFSAMSSDCTGKKLIVTLNFKKELFFTFNLRLRGY